MSPWVLLVIRVVAGLIFWQHGLEKLFGFAGARPEPTLWGIRGVGGILETVGGPLLVLGLFTRPTAFILSGEMAVAYFRSWAPRGFLPIANNGEEATLNAFLFLWLVFAGPGSLSLDALLFRPAQSALIARTDGLEPYFRGLMRVIVGFLLTLHGMRQLFDLFPKVAARRGTPELALDALPAIVGPLELVGGLLLICGIAVRPAAALLAALSLGAYVFVAQPRTLWPIDNGGNEALLYFVTLLPLAVGGGGMLWSAIGGRSRATRAPIPT